MPLKVCLLFYQDKYQGNCSNQLIEFAMLHDDEVIPKYASQIVIGRVKGQTPSLEL
jgi:hypothetical protein